MREENRGTELEGKTIGIIGFGNTGSSFAGKLKGFDVKILVYDPYVKLNSNKYPGILQVAVAEIFSECDVVSLHVPLTDETQFLVNEKFINEFRKPFYLINTSRGKVVSTDDLVEGLQSGKVKGAALDVLEFESISFENLAPASFPESFNVLTKMPNVILSPHIAGWTFESHRKISEVLAEKIISKFK
jgi:D-3-phosphoglycerate dehydrogenase